MRLLQPCVFCPDDSFYFAILQENVRLKVCNISWNGFGPEGGAAIGEALASNNSLLEIDVSGNRLSADSATKMARTVASNDTLRSIRVSYYGFFIFC